MFDPPGTMQVFDTHMGERGWVFFTVPQAGDAFARQRILVHRTVLGGYRGMRT